MSLPLRERPPKPTAGRCEPGPRRFLAGPLLLSSLLLFEIGGGFGRLAGQVPAPSGDEAPVGREAVESLVVPPLDFDPPRVEEKVLSGGTPVLFLEDRSLPLVDVFIRFDGGYAHFEREHYAPATALPTLLRTGGTRSLPPDSVDQLIELFALQTAFGSAGGSVHASLNTLTDNLEPGLELWVEMIRAPRFDPEKIEEWRGRSLESVRRRRDSPTALAYSEFNRLLFGDQPTGWEMTAEDLAPERLAPERMQWLHRRIFCRENMVVGVAGDVSWDRAEALLEEALTGWPECPAPLPEPAVSRPDAEAGVYLIHRDLAQSVVVMAEPGGVRSTDPDLYHASRIADAILGGSGFTSRLVSRVRTDAGLAYSVSSLWTAPSEVEGIVGAVTQTRADATIRAIRLVLDVMREMKEEPPRDDEVRTAVDRIANGFVCNCHAAARIVARRLLYLSQDRPEDWLERYVRGIQEVGPEDVHAVVSEHLHPDGMTILIVGDTTRFDASPSSLGPVRVLELP